MENINLKRESSEVSPREEIPATFYKRSEKVWFPKMNISYPFSVENILQEFGHVNEEAYDDNRISPILAEIAAYGAIDNLDAEEQDKATARFYKSLAQTIWDAKVRLASEITEKISQSTGELDDFILDILFKLSSNPEQFGDELHFFQVIFSNLLSEKIRFSDRVIESLVEQLPSIDIAMKAECKLVYSNVFQAGISPERISYLRNKITALHKIDPRKALVLKYLVAHVPGYFIPHVDNAVLLSPIESFLDLIGENFENYKRPEYEIRDNVYVFRAASDAYILHDVSTGKIKIIKDKEKILLLQQLIDKRNDYLNFPLGDDDTTEILNEASYKIGENIISFFIDELQENDFSLAGEHFDNSEYIYYSLASSPNYINGVEKILGINPTLLSIKEGILFLDLLFTINGDEFLDFKSTIQKFGYPFIKTVFTTCRDRKLLLKLLNFSKNNESVFLDEIFKTYGKVVEHVDDVGDYLKSTFGEGSTAHANAVVEQLLGRARKLLEETVSLKEGDTSSFIEKIKIIDADISLFTSACKALQKNSAFKITDISGVGVSEKATTALSPAEKEKLLSLQDQAYRSLYTPEFLASLRETLSRTLENPNTHFYFLRKNGADKEEIVSTLRFDEKDAASNTKHMASFFTDPSYNGGAIGEALLDEALIREQADGSAIVLECSPQLVAFYGRHGFVETGRFEFKGEQGVSMRKDPVMQPYTQQSNEQIFAEQKTA